MAVLMTPPYLTFFDNSTPGIPLNGGLIYTYAAGSTTLKATFTDYTEGVQAANPIVLDSQGRASVWISGSYKFVVKDALGNTIRTTDHVTSFTVPDVASNAYFQTFSGDAATTVFTVSQDLGTDEKALFIDIDSNDSKGYEPLNPNAYTINGTTLTFVSAPAAGTNNIYVRAPLTLLNAASAAAAQAATSETNAAASEVLAAQWASQTSGIVAVTDFSAKAWAIGGTGITNTSGKGAAKQWAITTGATVDTSEYSAKEYAIGTFIRGSIGSAKDWATYLGGTVDGANYSAAYQAGIATTGADTSTAQAVIATGAANAAIAAVASVANEWLFATSTTMADPGTGKFRLNNATPASVTNVALSALSGDSGNPNLHSYLLTWDDSNNTPRGVIRLEKDATNFIMLGVSGNITDGTTWVEIPVTVIASAGSFSSNDPVFVNFVQYGNNGTVSTTGSPATGNLVKFSGGATITNADLMGDGSTSGGMDFTLATVNSNVGMFTNATVIVNAKGLVTAAASGAGSSFHPGYVSGRYYFNGFWVDNFGTGGNTLTADRLYALPLEIGASGTIAKLGLNVNSAAASGKVARIGIYNMANGVPTTLVLDAGTVAIDATGDVEITGLTQAITPGCYAIALLMNGTPKFTNGISPDVARMTRFWGLATAGGSTPIYAAYTAQAYGTLPSNWPGALTYTADSGDGTSVWFRT